MDTIFLLPFLLVCPSILYRSITRSSSRNSVKSGQKKIQPIDLKKTIGNAESEGTGEQTTSSEVKKPDGTNSPIQGWDAKENNEEHELIPPKSLHEDEKQAENEEEEENFIEGIRPDGRIDSSAVNNDQQQPNTEEQENTPQDNT